MNAQISCKGIIQNIPSNTKSKISIEQWTDDIWMETDTVSLAADNSFNIKIVNTHIQARIRMWGQNIKWVDFIIPQNSPGDSVLDFGIIDYNAMRGGVAKLKDRENVAYYKLTSANRKFKLFRDSLLLSYSPTDSDLLKKNERIYNLLLLFNQVCKEIRHDYKGTYTAEVISKIVYHPVKMDYPDNEKLKSISDKEFDRQYFLDQLPFYDKRILSHNSFIKAIINYADLYAKNDTTDVKLFIDRLMNKRQGNDEVDAWIYRNLLFKYVNNRDEVSLSYLLKNYNDDCTAETSSKDQSVSNLLKALKNCEVGRPAFNTQLPDENGQNNELASIAAKAKLTLLFFWRSDCSHCREFEPELVGIYNKYKPLGLEIIGISMDVNEANWKKYLKSNPMRWKNLHMVTLDQRNQIKNNYPVPATPTLIAVDQNFIVKNRLVLRATLEKYLDQELKN
ncbi:MAG TPA: thioredoxin family protein [Saprospiraceae bacterium]|nr:thioredoxin family protein [Saprospiraceae bacterium]